MTIETVNFQKEFENNLYVAKETIKNVLEPKIEQYKSDFFTDDRARSKFRNETAVFLARTNTQCSIMNTLAFPNEPKKLQDLYEVMTITLPTQDTELHNAKRLAIDGANSIFEFGNHIVLDDNAGMGKSTIAKKVASDHFNNKTIVPLFIELRKITSGSITEYLKISLGLDDITPDFLANLPLIFIFDGLDEVPLNYKTDIVRSISNLAEQCTNNNILVTTRKEGVVSELFSFVFGQIESLKKEQALSILKKYDSNGEISQNLIKTIESNGNSLEEFLSTPLYVSLLYCSFRHKSTIPHKKHLFYSQVYEALFEQHDLSKQTSFVRPKNSKLDSAEFHELLRRLGFKCLTDSGKLEFQLDELVILVKKLVDSMSGFKTNPADFVKDLTTTVPIFIKEGSTVRWSHKALMEYFAAMFICNDTKEKQKELLIALYDSDKWTSYQHLFELCIDIDFTTFRSSILNKILSESIDYFDNSYTKIANKRISKTTIQKRKSICYLTDMCFTFLKKGEMTRGLYRFQKDSSTILQTNPTIQLHDSDYTEYKGETTGILISYSSSKERMVLELLSRRCRHLFIDQASMDSSKLYASIDKCSLKHNTTYTITDSPNCLTNNSKNFGITTEIGSLAMGKLALNYDSILKESKAISNDGNNGVDDLVAVLL